ncbi:MAG: DNA translocase FtsK 4TM domain-containing protein, partial [Actinomycetota bacterium]
MATKTSPSRRSASRASKTPSKTTRKPARKTSRKAPAKKAAPAKTPVRQILSPWARDALGIGLVVLALLAVLGVWFDAAGPVGGWLTWVLRGAFGVAAVTFPVVGVYWGILLLRDTAREERVRMFIGFTVFGFGVLGLLSLLGGNPAPREGYAALGWAGGLFGAVAAHPLTSVVSALGAAVVCLGLAALGLLIFTGTPVAVAWRTAVDFFTAADVEDDEPEPAPMVLAEPEPERPKRRIRLREAFGLEDPELLVVPEAGSEAGFGPVEPEEEAAPPKARKPRPRTIETADGPYQLPPLDLLRSAPPSSADTRDEATMQAALERTLQTFGVDAKVSGAHRGPTVTMYEVEVAAGTKVQKVLSLAGDIAY